MNWRPFYNRPFLLVIKGFGAESGEKNSKGATFSFSERAISHGVEEFNFPPPSVSLTLTPLFECLGNILGTRLQKVSVTSSLRASKGQFKGHLQALCSFRPLSCGLTGVIPDRMFSSERAAVKRPTKKTLSDHTAKKRNGADPDEQG